MANRELVDEAYDRARDVLLKCAHQKGIKAAEEYYPHVWARDGVIASFGALLLDDGKADLAVRATLETLGERQNETGHVPNFLPLDSNAPPGTNNAIDSNLWFIIGHHHFFQRRGDREFLTANFDRLTKAAFWLRCQDFNDCGLLESHEGSDWADLLANRFNVLFPNVLYFRALSAMAEIAEGIGRDGSSYARSAKDVERKLNLLFWLPDDEAARTRAQAELAKMNGEWSSAYAQASALYWSRPYYLPYVLWRIVGDDRLDTLGNLLAILFGLADPARANAVLDYIRERGVNRPYPAKACYPVIQPGHPDWRPYYLNREYCKPHSAHNGGIWPFIGGFYVAALVRAGRKDEAKRELELLAQANRQSRSVGEWGFNELLHGETGLPIGAEHQAWSAAMYLVAHHAVRRGDARF